MTLLTAILSFSVVALASREIGHFLGNYKLPHITGYLLAGVLVGPFVLDLITTEAAHDLRFLEEVSLAIIAFLAGSELYLNELEGRFTVIGWNALAQLFFIYLFGSLSVYLMTDIIPFTKAMSNQTQLAVAILAGTVLVSRSPSAVIAIIKEVRAKGPFTKTVLGITLSMDILIIVLFTLNAMFARILINGDSFSPSFLGTLVINFGVDALMGYFIYRVLRLIFALRIHRIWKIILVTLTGYSIFVLAHEIAHWTHEHLPVEVVIEPLLPAMIASFLLTNYSSHRLEFIETLEDIAPFIYVAFFTVTGITLNLDILVDTIGIAVVLFLVRLAGIFAGSQAGNILSGERKYANYMWLAFISQAGVSLGLTREAAGEFPSLGDNFATMLISVIVLNEMVGPIFLRYALNTAGESQVPERTAIDERRDAVIFGIEPQSIALARQLHANRWKVILADVTPTSEHPPTEDIDFHNLDEINEKTLARLITAKTDALVAMLQKDSDNFKVCQYVHDHFEGMRLIVRLNDPTWTSRFSELGATVVNPTDAMITLLDQYVRTPQSAALFMHRDPTHKIAQVTITDKDYDNKPLRDLRLPGDVLILGITRDGHSIVPHGYTTLKLFDEVTLVGEPKQLEDIIFQLGY